MLEGHTRGFFEGLLKLLHAERKVADVVLKSRDSFPAVFDRMWGSGGRHRCYDKLLTETIRKRSLQLCLNVCVEGGVVNECSVDWADDL